MQQQKSFQNEDQKGILYLVPTPIGNLEDMTYRAVRIMKEVDFIAAEDTRNTKKLCNYFEMSTALISYHEHNKEASGQKIIEKLKEGLKIALVSDAGMPAISDPGFDLVTAALKENITVVPLPGANAGLTALIASGITTQPFYFYGFLDRQKKNKRKQLSDLSNMTATIIFYEAPHRLKETLILMEEQWGDRQIVLCRELTKKYEEFIRGSLIEVIQWAKNEEIRGEFCLIVEGGEPAENDIEAWWRNLTVVEHVDHYINMKELAVKDAVKQAAADRQLPKREVYQAYHIEND
jgi:16S rRNA (cytidine1402-2'-O)-methyltransferase